MKQAEERKNVKSEIKQLIGFFVGAEEYGLEILRVREIIRVREITRLPRSPGFVKGIINLRGDVIPILSLGERFGLERKEASADTRVIVVEIGGQLIGMVVDAVSQVLRVPADQIDPPPPIIGGLAREYVAGVAKVGDRLVILLNIDRILSKDEQVQLADLEADGGEPAGGGQG